MTLRRGFFAVPFSFVIMGTAASTIQDAESDYEYVERLYKEGHFDGNYPAWRSTMLRAVKTGIDRG